MASRLTIQVFKVKGKGRFPIDMLRYDHCFPLQSDDAAKIAATFEHYYSDETVEITLVSYFGKPNYPTEGRWASFGWTVFHVAPLEVRP